MDTTHSPVELLPDAAAMLSVCDSLSAAAERAFQEYLHGDVDKSRALDLGAVRQAADMARDSLFQFILTAAHNAGSQAALSALNQAEIARLQAEADRG